MKRNAFVAIIFAATLLSLTVLSMAKAESDVTPPVLVWVTVEPPMIDTSDAARTITATFRISDDLSGLNRAVLSLTPKHAAGSQNARFRMAERERVSGDALDGVYVNSVTLPRYSYEGVWVVNILTLFDIVGNYGWFGRYQLPDPGWRVQADIVHDADAISNTIEMLSDIVVVNVVTETPGPTSTLSPETTPTATTTNTPMPTNTPAALYLPSIES